MSRSRRRPGGSRPQPSTSRAESERPDAYPEDDGPAPLPVIAIGQGRLGREVAAWTVCGYLLLIMAGYLLLLHGHVMRTGNELSRDRAFFMAVDAATLTGFRTSQQFSSESITGPLIVLALTLGGMVTSLMVGGLAAVRILRLPYSDRQVIAWSVCCTFGAMLLGSIFFWEAGSEFSFAKVIFCFQRTASAFGNSGVITGTLPEGDSWQTQAVLMPLVVLGGLGLPVLMEFYSAIRERRPFSRHTNTVLVMTAGIYLVSVAVIYLIRELRGLNSSGQFATSLGSCSITAINTRTAGFPYQFASSLPRVMQWLVIILMMIGASPAGTGGGLKTTTLVQLVKGIRASFRGEAPGRAFSIAATWLSGYFCLALVTFIALVWTQSDLPADRIFFETISAVSNVGISYDTVLTTREGLFLLSAGMLFGRLLPLGVLWWMAQTTEDAEVAVG